MSSFNFSFAPYSSTEDETQDISPEEQQLRVIIPEFLSTCMKPSYNSLDSHDNKIRDLMGKISRTDLLEIAQKEIFMFFCCHFNSNTDALSSKAVAKISSLIFVIGGEGSFPIFLVRNASSFSAYQLAFWLLRRYKRYTLPEIQDVLVLMKKFLSSDYEKTHAQAFAEEVNFLPSIMSGMDCELEAKLLNELEQFNSITPNCNLYVTMLSHCLVALNATPSAKYMHKCLSVATNLIASNLPTKLQNRMLYFMYLVLLKFCPPPPLSEDEPIVSVITEKMRVIGLFIYEMMLKEIKQPSPLRLVSIDEMVFQFTMDNFNTVEDDFSMRGVAEEVLNILARACKPAPVENLMNRFLKVTGDKQELEAKIFMLGALSSRNTHTPHTMAATKLAMENAKQHNIPKSSEDYAKAESLRCAAVRAIGAMAHHSTHTETHIPFWKEVISALQTQQSDAFITEALITTIKLVTNISQRGKSAVLETLQSLVNAIKHYVTNCKPPILALVCELASSTCSIPSDVSLKFLAPFEEIIYLLKDQLVERNTYAKYCQMISDQVSSGIVVPRSYIYTALKHYLAPNLEIMLNMKEDMVPQCVQCLYICFVVLRHMALEFLTKKLAKTLVSLISFGLKCSEAFGLLSMYSSLFKQEKPKWLPKVAPIIMKQLHNCIDDDEQYQDAAFQCFFRLAEYFPITSIEPYQDSILKHAIMMESVHAVGALAKVSPKFMSSRISDILGAFTPQVLVDQSLVVSSAFLDSFVTLVWHNSDNGSILYCEPSYFEDHADQEENDDVQPASKRKRVSSSTVQDSRHHVESVDKAIKLLLSIDIELLAFELKSKIGRLLDHFRRRTPARYWTQFDSKTVQSYLECVSFFSEVPKPLTDVSLVFYK